MDIESNEAKLVMDENGRCIDIVKRDRGTSECMIEEFMLLANQCAANAGRTNKAPFVYRVHEAPDAEKMEKLSATLLACGLNAKFKNPIPTQLELAALLDEWTKPKPQGGGGPEDGDGDRIVWAPVFNFYGNTTKEEAVEAARMSFAEFKKMYKQMKAEERRKKFAPA